MCLIVYRGALPRKAHADITVYKVVQKTDGGLFISPYMRTPLFVEGDLPITKVDQKDFRIEQDIYWDVPVDNVYEGGFHCYKHLADALREKNFLHCDCSISSVRYYVVECTVLINTIYYEGDYWGHPSFCVKKLIINKIIQ